jgi:hypothetical protein
VWSPANNLNDSDTVHWTGKPHHLNSLARIDGKVFRLMGKEPAGLPALPQKIVQVLPTRTICSFEGEGVKLEMTFMTPALPDDLMIYSRPVTYLTWTCASTTSATHQVEVYFDAGGELAVNTGDQKVKSETLDEKSWQAVWMGSVDQRILGRRGDDLRIEWGHFYIAASVSEQFHMTTATEDSPGAAAAELREKFGKKGADAFEGKNAEVEGPGRTVVAACASGLGKVGPHGASRWLVLAYDDQYSIQYFGRNLRPYWRKDRMDGTSLVMTSLKEYTSLVKRCVSFDEELMSSLNHAGGDKYARICALAYRQCCAANKVVADVNGQPLMFPKENFSNGCIGTVDVIYPMAPQFLLFSPALTRAMLEPIMAYAASQRWRFPFAPHDLGTYPLANGQVYGGGERTEQNQMPVEETGNMLVLLAALAQVEGNADYAKRFWPVIEKWVEYLQSKGFDPENQLCTDDFAGHLAHNVNLSAKAICGLGAYARLCEMRGDKARANETFKQAREFAARWVKEADDGDHSRLAFDKPGTWSQKYNLVWDRILGLKLFSESVARKEMDFYLKHQKPFGLPLDNRKDYTKLDWTLWTATLTQNRNDFQALVDPVWRFLNETTNRVPMTDWYWTTTAKQSGFQARSVVGGVFLQMLYDRALWKHWAGKSKLRPMDYASLPQLPVVTTIVPTSERQPATWRYTTQKPDDSWFKKDFDASAWSEGPAGYGTRGTPGAVVRTEWSTADIWLRREINLPETKWANPQFRVHHDEDVEIYINGVLACQSPGFTTTYENLAINKEGREAFKPGPNVIAVHCKQTTGGQYIDVGLVDLR